MHISAIDHSGSTGRKDSDYWKMVRSKVKKGEKDTRCIL